MSADVALSGSPPSRWSRLLAGDSGADYFHTPVWTETTARYLPGGRPVWLTLCRDGQLLGGLSAVVHGSVFRRTHSGPHGCSGGPLVSPDLDQAQAARVVTALLDALLEVRGAGLASCGVALNPVHEQRWGKLLASLGGWRRQDNRAAVIPLPDEEGLLVAQLRRSKRKERDRALRRGVTAAVSDDPEDLASYHRLHVDASNLWGVPAQPLDLLGDLIAAPADATGGAAWFVCVRCEGEVIGGHLNLQRGDWVTAWNGVTDPTRARTLYPATLAVWADMVEAQRRGARWLDLGASGGSASLGFFKEGFGAEIRHRGWYVADTRLARLVRGLRGIVGRRDSLVGGRRLHDPSAPVAQDGGT